MTLSVKPFGCMPSSGVSDGVQSLITGLYPESIFCAIETSGDGRVNVQSRVQMFLFKARLAAQREYAEALQKLGVTADDVKRFLAEHPRFATGLRRSPHAAAGTAADRLAEIAPFMTGGPGGKTMSNAAIAVAQLRSWAAESVRTIRATPDRLGRLRKAWTEKSPRFIAQVREEWEDARPILTEQVRARAKAGVDGVRAAVTRRPGKPVDRTVVEARA
jgi:hypothetical protein